MSDRRAYTRLEMHAGVFIIRGETAFLTEVSNVSAGGVSVVRPENWQEDPDGIYHLYFVLDPDRILCLKGSVVHESVDHLGFTFAKGYAIQSEQLLAESRTWL